MLLPRQTRTLWSDTPPHHAFAYLAFDPDVSPHYEVFLVPAVPEKPPPPDRWCGPWIVVEEDNNGVHDSDDDISETVSSESFEWESDNDDSLALEVGDSVDGNAMDTLPVLDFDGTTQAMMTMGKRNTVEQ
ncbi:hypothetical protein BAE44_0007350 [Dichanthelium oligosanthes]|uniref:Uncharacterized protein n=1 Tax=Dichanthelium oligosanthes TaxID=888268 RepID=A0A1E5W2X4_9POAL|nr:hypothetical protein BAE44_0007350 [Dichanthelium oligosanthes]